MKCPNCQSALQVSQRKNIEIDHCPLCRGVWLDRGELDKLLEFAAREQEYQKLDDDAEEIVVLDAGQYGSVPSQGAHSEVAAEQHPQTRGSFWRELFDFG